MCALLASTDKIVRIVNRGQVYEGIYKPESTHNKPALKNLLDALVDLYKATLELLAESELFSKNTPDQIIYAILHPGKTKSLVSNLDDLETKLDLEVQACQSAWSADANKQLTDLLYRLDAPLTRVDERVGDLLERVDETEHLQILDWISPILSGKHHDEKKGSRTPGTCEWLLRHDRFREWERTSSSMIFWLQGSRECRHVRHQYSVGG
jgi:hypothetical protein